jgi:hypothetical protein
VSCTCINIQGVSKCCIRISHFVGGMYFETENVNKQFASECPSSKFLVTCSRVFSYGEAFVMSQDKADTALANGSHFCDDNTPRLQPFANVE